MPKNDGNYPPHTSWETRTVGSQPPAPGIGRRGSLSAVSERVAYRAFKSTFGSSRYAPLYAGQQGFLARLQAQQGLTLWTGRMAHAGGRWYEKGVDVALAYAGEYEVAVLVSGDGDLAPAVHEVRRIGRRVENAMIRARRSWHLVQESTRFIPI
ncbi:MAG: NYN domain-containing protein, partial [Candidatus Rokubacteria bacterium]|nr:NYN domain-containing protein [Candidatus Rokubacteria bacterium]